MSKNLLKMGTRGSALALAQARQFAATLEFFHPGLKVEEHIIRTTGDKNQASPLPQIGGKGVFTLEIEAALLGGEIDFAVHSLKDLPPAMPDGLILACVPLRESPADCLILNPNGSEDEGFKGELSFLPLGSKVGTSSLRRRAMLLNLRPDLQIEDVRGNIDTRLRKLQDENFAAIVLARAGLNRLEVEGIRANNLPESWFVPAPGQGALAIQARTDDLDTRSILLGLQDEATRSAVEAERAVVAELNAGCSTPLGAIARAYGDTLSLHATVLSPDGKHRIAVSVQGSGAPDLIGQRAARSLLEKGAGELLGH
ncbi:porphobilinogen deaminase [Abditibacteriota bacterium]|nr:porphobilinogen deaminase [Abditibacteriota bacterium]